jgi:hypothetical protein
MTILSPELVKMVNTTADISQLIPLNIYWSHISFQGTLILEQ